MLQLKRKKEKRRRKTKISKSREGRLRGESRGESVEGRGERGEGRGIRGEKYLNINKLITFCQIVDQNKRM